MASMHSPRMNRLIRMSMPLLRKQTTQSQLRGASTATPQTDKSRILEKPTRFNPPSHGSRRTRSRPYPGPKLSEDDAQRQKSKRYPNMMPPEGSFMHWFLHNRGLHLWITLSTLVSLAIYSISMSFITHTQPQFRDQLPSSADFFSHPFHSISQFVSIYKLHVAFESEKVAEKRRKKLEDVEKRKEFMRAHGVEPGFLTGSWMDKFGTVEGDNVREAMAQKDQEREGSPIADVQEHERQIAAMADDQASQNSETRRQRPKPKMWFGIW